jgi:hypothetical protein
VYAWCDPAGLGSTVDRALDAAPASSRVVVCGPRPGAGRTGARTWADQLGGWFPTKPAHVTRSALRAELARDGQTVSVSRAEPWFGVSTTPADAAGAMRVIRHVTLQAGVRPFGTPGQTGRRMLAEMWAAAGAEWPTAPAGVGDVLRSTSGQGRYQFVPEHAGGGAELAYVDARFQYGALAGLELPVGEPVERAGELPDEYAPAWCHVDFTPPAGCALAVLGVYDEHGWQWPTSGTWSTWCAGAEVHAARGAGYRVKVRGSIVWPGRARPLGAWSRLVVRERERVAGLPLDAGVRDAARAGLRGIVVQAIGSIHGRASTVPVGDASASSTRTVGAHPEWSTAIWAAARVRLARVMADQRAPIVACATDGFYVAGAPVIPPDDGRAGRWVEVWNCVDWPAVGSMTELRALRDAP